MISYSSSIQLGTIHTNGENRNLAVVLGGSADMAMLLSDYYVTSICIEDDWRRGRQAEIAIKSSGPVERIPLSEVKNSLRSADDLSIDELMKIVYQKLDQRSLS